MSTVAPVAVAGAPEEKVDYACSCKLDKAGNKPSAATPNREEAKAALDALTQPVTDAITASGKTGNPTDLQEATTAANAITPLVTTLITALGKAGVDKTVVEQKMAAVKGVIDKPATAAADYTQPLTELQAELTKLGPIIEKVVSGGKRKHTRRKHCSHGKNIMHCPYCKHGTKGKHCNKSKKGKKRRRTRKLDRIARSLERSLESSLNESHNSKKSKRSRRKSK